MHSKETGILLALSPQVKTKDVAPPIGTSHILKYSGLRKGNISPHLAKKINLSIKRQNLTQNQKKIILTRMNSWLIILISITDHFD